VSQNGNARGGLERLLDPDPRVGRTLRRPTGTRFAHSSSRRRPLGNTTTAYPTTTGVSPDGYSLDNFYLSRRGVAKVQLDLFGDYKSSVALYPTFREYIPTGRIGQKRPILPAGGAEAFKRDIPNATVRFFDTRHFAPETHAPEVAAAIRGFLP
jgi:pimeloyl-ACP methyl ester carboxylesterase